MCSVPSLAGLGVFDEWSAPVQDVLDLGCLILCGEVSPMPGSSPLAWFGGGGAAVSPAAPVLGLQVRPRMRCPCGDAPPQHRPAVGAAPPSTSLPLSLLPPTPVRLDWPDPCPGAGPSLCPQPFSLAKSLSHQTEGLRASCDGATRAVHQAVPACSQGPPGGSSPAPCAGNGGRSPFTLRDVGWAAPRPPRPPAAHWERGLALLQSWRGADDGGRGT